MSKIGEKEDPVLHVQGHIVVAASRSQTASEMMVEVVAGLRPIEDVIPALDSIEDHIRDANRHIRQLHP